jgi:hypothetical protein
VQESALFLSSLLLSFPDFLLNAWRS